MSNVQKPDVVELLLRRIAQRTLAGSLLTGAAACATGCMVDDAEPQSAAPSAEADEAVEALARVIKPRKPLPPGSLSDGGVAVHPGSPDAGAPTGVACDTNVSYPVRAAGLKTPETYDYLAIREVSGFGRSGADAGAADWQAAPSMRVLSETGTACDTASTPACSSKVAGHPTQFLPTFCTQICIENAIVTTRGDEVRRWTVDQLGSLLGPIDSPDEALLRVGFAGYQLSCNQPEATSVREVDGGYEVIATRMTKDCAPIIRTRYRIFVARDGALQVLDQGELSREENACVGRMAGHVDVQRAGAGASAVGDYLAHSAQLEAASVHAFSQLACELEAHGAPVELVARARAACADEVRHAEVVAALARARGGIPGVPEVHATPVRTLEQIAHENAVEGCVRETYGALVGAHQAARATDRELRAAMTAIADDEARHAALSHAVHAWIMDKLDAAARGRVMRAQVAAIGELACAAELDPSPSVGAATGLPEAVTAQRMIDALARELWLPSLAA